MVSQTPTPYCSVEQSYFWLHSKMALQTIKAAIVTLRFVQESANASSLKPLLTEDRTFKHECKDKFDGDLNEDDTYLEPTTACEAFLDHAGWYWA